MPNSNGRLGRLIVPLFMSSKGLLSQPNFYLSAYFERNRDAYYDHLLAVSRDSDWTGWVKFFLEALIAQATENQQKVMNILSLYHERKLWIADATHSQHAIKALDWIFARPIFQTSDFVAHADIPRATALRIVRILRERDMLREIHPSSGRRAAVMAFPPLLNIVEGNDIL